MASVQELILAAQAQAKPSPLASVLEQFGAGVGKAQDQGLDRITKLIQLDQMRQEMVQQEQMQKEIQTQLAGQKETETTNAFHTVSGAPKPVMPTQKLTQKITQNEKGKYSRSFEVVETDPAGTKGMTFKPQEYDDNGVTKIGKWSDTQGLVKSPDDPVAKVNTGVPDKSMQKEITKAKVAVAKTRPMVESTVAEITRVQDLNKKSFGGAVGSFQMKARRATGIGDESPEFKNTADVVNTMQAQVAKVLKSTFGGQLSDGERMYLNEVYGALPGMSRTERDIAMTNVKTMLNAKLEGDEGTLQELLADAGIEAETASASAPPPTSKRSKEQDPLGLFQ